MPYDLSPMGVAHFVGITKVSSNRKVGPIPVSNSSSDTCPDACPLKGAGCYAEGGPLAIHWRKITERKAGMAYAKFLEAIQALPRGQLWRHNQAGDLQPDPTDPEKIDQQALAALVKANRGKRGFTYTHFNMADPDNVQAVRDANKGGFTVNLSGNNPEHADTLADTGAGPVVTVLPIEYQRGKDETQTAYKARLQTLPTHTPAGRKIAVCPATYTETDCARCQACAVADRLAVIGFPAHGFRKRKASEGAGGVA